MKNDALNILKMEKAGGLAMVLPQLFFTIPNGIPERSEREVIRRVRSVAQ